MLQRRLCALSFVKHIRSESPVEQGLVASCTLEDPASRSGGYNWSYSVNPKPGIRHFPTHMEFIKTEHAVRRCDELMMQLYVMTSGFWLVFVGGTNTVLSVVESSGTDAVHELLCRVECHLYMCGNAYVSLYTAADPLRGEQQQGPQISYF